MAVDRGFTERYVRLGQLFLPHTPIDRKSLFAGRIQQIAEVLDAIVQRGRHIVLFGERGVGKTSLAKVINEFSQEEGRQIAPYVTCDSSDDFSSICKKIFGQVEVVEDKPRMGFTSTVNSSVKNLAEMVQGQWRPFDVLRLLQFLSESANVVVTIDEFDRIAKSEVTTLFADTIKVLSDNDVPATLLLVGVANSVNDLVQEHASAERACAQIRMPRMASNELREIVTERLSEIEMSIEPDALSFIVSLSQGLPHYTHLIGLYAARSVLLEGREKITRPDVSGSLSDAIAQVGESISYSYHVATLSSKQTIYPQVLLASALAKLDERGTFAPRDVVEPMTKIMKKPYDTTGFAKNLHDLCGESRGPILHRVGVPNRYRYRFVNPLMQPFIIMRGLNGGLISEEDLISQGVLELEKA